MTKNPPKLTSINLTSIKFRAYARTLGTLGTPAPKKGLIGNPGSRRFPETFRKFPGNFLENSRIVPRIFPEISRKNDKSYRVKG